MFLLCLMSRIHNPYSSSVHAFSGIRSYLIIWVFVLSYVSTVSSLCSYAVRDGMSFRKCSSWEQDLGMLLTRRFLPFLWFIAGIYRFAIEVTHCNSYWSLSGTCLPTYKLDSLGNLFALVLWPFRMVRGGWGGGVIFILHLVPCKLNVPVPV